MEYTPLTPFRRAIDAVPAELLTPSPPLPGPVDKWHLLKDLTTARETFNVSHRDITVLQALLSFYPGQHLASGPELIVFPSNQTLCARLNGMPCSTMRRHLARLVEVGLIARRDSPNGKRYLRRRGAERTAFGLDLAPLLHRTAAISAAVEKIRTEADHLRTLRETASLMRRDVANLAALGFARDPEAELCAEASSLASDSARALRRKLSRGALYGLIASLEQILARLCKWLELTESAEMSTDDTQIEHLQQKTEKDHSLEEGAERTTLNDNPTCSGQSIETRKSSLETVPPKPLRWTLTDVLRAYPEIGKYSQKIIESWQDLSDTAEFVTPMMGISPCLWAQIRRTLGSALAGITVAATLEHFDSIRSPVAYLRSLAQRAIAGQFRLPA